MCGNHLNGGGDFWIRIENHEETKYRVRKRENEIKLKNICLQGWQTYFGYYF